MTLRTPRIAVLFAMTFAIATAATIPALAEDGVIEINQAKINASGFPIFSISSSGSYKLTSNITVTAAATEAISNGDGGHGGDDGRGHFGDDSRGR
jgi:hypothetical protein